MAVTLTRTSERLYTEFKARRFFTSLDGIRTASILAVIWHHTGQPIDWLPISGRGFLGVDMFFVLSGFLIVTLLLRERDRTGTISLKKFYMRRALRIFPVYYGLLLVLFLGFFLVIPNSDLASRYFTSLPYYITYTSNWLQHDPFPLLAITWSLAAEEQFYIVWPPIEKYLKQWLLPIGVVLLAINQLINFGVIFQNAHTNLEILQSTFTPILLGVLLAHLLHSNDGFSQLARITHHRYASLAFAVGLLITINIPVADISGWPRLLIHLLMTGFLASCVVNENHILQPMMTLSPIARLGVISYGMYLFHMFARHGAVIILERLSLNFPILLFLLCLGATIVIAEISYRFYETPFLKLKKRWVTT